MLKKWRSCAISKEVCNKKVEEKTKQKTKKKTNNTQGDSHKETADLSIETLQARREWQDILKVMKENNLQLRLLYPARISFKFEGEIKSLQSSTS